MGESESYILKRLGQGLASCQRAIHLLSHPQALDTRLWDVENCVKQFVAAGQAAIDECIRVKAEQGRNKA